MFEPFMWTCAMMWILCDVQLKLSDVVVGILYVHPDYGGRHRSTVYV